MKYVPYGKTGKNVSVVGFGGMRFNQDRPNEENAEIVRYACSKGINYFDTAPGYGKSEDIFGIAFQDMPGEWYCTTKAMPTSFETAEAARGAVMKSLERMRTDKIHFFHVWCLRKMEHYELAMKPGGMYEGLLACREEGLIEHIVVSSHQPGGEIRQILSSGEFEGVLLGMNIVNFPYRLDGAKAAREMGRGVVAMNPLGGGMIPRHEKELAFLAEGGETATDAAIRFAIHCPYIDVALVGFTTKRQIDQACRIAETGEPLTDEDLDRIRKHLGRNMNELCTGCNYCEGCPVSIPVASYMQAYNDKLLDPTADMAKKMDFHRNWGLLVGAEATAEACVECGQCEEACTQHLPIIDRLKELAEVEKTLGS